MRTLLGILASLLILSSETRGQSWQEHDESKPDVMLEVFQKKLPDENVRKIHGRTYFNPHPGIDEYQFFKTSQLSTGMVYTQKDTLKDVHLYYDISRDRLIVFSRHVNAMIELEEEFITQFQINIESDDTPHRFINTRFIKDYPESLWPGFHQLVYDSPDLCFYKKHMVSFYREPDGNVYVAVFKKREHLIYKHGEQYIHVRKKKDLLTQYPGSENEIKKYLREKGIKLKKAGDTELRALGIYLRQLGG